MYKVQRSITIDLLFYYLHAYVDIIYYHVPFYFIKSINSKIKKEGAQNITFDLNIYFRNKQNIT